MAEQVLLVFSTHPDADGAERLAEELVELGLAACVNLSPPLRSIYRWEGNTERAQEVLLKMETTRAAYPRLEAAIRERHPYEVPQIIAVAAGAGLPDYLDWVRICTKDS